MRIATYLHVIEGRMRIKIPGVKGSTKNASRIERSLCKVNGIEQVEANALTGSVMVRFDSRAITHQQVVRELRKLNHFGTLQRPSRHVAKLFQPNNVEKMLAEVFLHTAIEFAFKRLVFALI